MVHPESGDVVPREQIRRGLEIEPGSIRMVEPEVLAEAEPEPSRELYERARGLDVPGRSRMNKKELIDAVRARTARAG